MTRDELEATTSALLEECIYQCQQQKPITPGFWIRHDNANDPIFFAFSGPLADMLNSGNGKDFLFAVVRHWIESLRADAVFLHTEAWQFSPNDAAASLEGGWEKHVDKGFRWLIENGYGNVVQIMFIVGMNPEWTSIAKIQFSDSFINGERRLSFGERDLNTQPLDKFSGRMKMFGRITEPEIQTYYDQIAPTVAEFINKIQ